MPTIGAGVLAVLLGFYDLFGGGCGVLGFLGGGRGDVPDNPFLTSGQQRGFEGFVEAALVYDPVNAGIGMLVGMVGVLLIFAGGLQFSPSAQRGLVGRVAFGASMVVDGLQILWAVLWYILMWGPMVEYVRAITEGMPDQPPDAENLVGVVTAITVVFMAGVTSLYFAIKIAVAGWGLWRTTRADRVLEGREEVPAAPASQASSATRAAPEPAARTSEPGLSWALDDEERTSDADDVTGAASEDSDRS